MPKAKGLKVQCISKWSNSLVGIIKLNTDAFICPSNHFAFGGGIIRDSNGTWLLGFTMQFGKSTILMAELKAIFHGIRLVKQRCFRRVVVENDNMEVVNMLNGLTLVHGCYSSIIQAIRGLIEQGDCFSFFYGARETNVCADHLAKMAV